MSMNKKRSSLCEKLMQLMRSFFKLSSCPLKGTDAGSSSSVLPPPNSHHPTVKQPKDPTRKPPNSRHADGSDGGGSSSFIKIQGINHSDIGIADDASWYSGIQSSELKASVTNLVASDYIRRFHERNKHESVLLVLPPPPPPPPPPQQPPTPLPQRQFLVK
ncbi:unnamed protein product [Lactuca virosa]|uniref:Uncharacterized protein n=1 Tax=Lactuca virosa TaxID=75947 RepID=A0AAU9LZE3_9ASTR|nr:unnamed protein product [Lactuca virosa]